MSSAEFDRLGALLLSTDCPRIKRDRRSLVREVDVWLEASLHLDPALPVHKIEGIKFLRDKLCEKKIILDTLQEEED